MANKAGKGIKTRILKDLMFILKTLVFLNGQFIAAVMHIHCRDLKIIYHLDIFTTINILCVFFQTFYPYSYSLE